MGVQTPYIAWSPRILRPSISSETGCEEHSICGALSSRDSRYRALPARQRRHHFLDFQQILRFSNGLRLSQTITGIGFSKNLSISFKPRLPGRILETTLYTLVLESRNIIRFPESTKRHRIRLPNRLFRTVSDVVKRFQTV